MAYMDLMRGLRSGERVQYPIYEMESLSAFTAGLVQSGQWPAFLSVIYAGNADISAAFPDGIPPTVESDGVVCRNDYKYVSGSPAWTLKTQAFSGLAPTATPPDDWSTNFFDYYTASTRTVSGNTFAVFTNVASGALTYPNSPPTWNPNTSYYHDDLPLQQRAAHIFTTDEGWSFGVNISPNWQYGYIRAVANCNPEHALVGTNDVFCIHDPGGAQYGGYIPSDTLAPYQLQMGFTSSIPFLQIFVHCVYNEVDYYGIAQILMSGTSKSAHPIGIRLLAFPAECYGDSIKTGDEPQGGEWGESTQRAGGQGLHAATSDARGDRAGTTVRDIMSSRDSALALAFDTPFMRTYTFDNLSSSQIAEIFAILYGTDYWSLFQNQMLNPLASIVAFHLIPSTLRGANLTLEDLIIGPKNISAAMTGTPQVTKIKQIKWYHIGTVDMSDVLLPYFDAYPDFAPYTDIILHLPYIGDIKIDVNAVMYGALSVEYACDNVSGNVAAWIYCEDRYPEPQTHKQYKYIATGNCAYSIPLFAQSQSGLDVGKIIGSGVGIVGGVATGNLAAAVSGAMGIGSALYEHSRAPITTQQTGGSSGNVAILGDSDVWIEVIRPQWIQPESYQQLVGIPSGISGTLSEIGASGRVVCSDIETDGIAATEPELREIERLLLSGIYLKP